MKTEHNKKTIRMENCSVQKKTAIHSNFRIFVLFINAHYKFMYVGKSSYNSRDRTDQRVQSFMFMMMMMTNSCSILPQRSYIHEINAQILCYVQISLHSGNINYKCTRSKLHTVAVFCIMTQCILVSMVPTYLTNILPPSSQQK